MRLDHIAYRVADRHKTIDFFIKAFGYSVQTEFDIQFPDGSTARCFALEPPEKNPKLSNCGFGPYNPGWVYEWYCPRLNEDDPKLEQPYHLAPEIFVSDGTPDSIVGRWVAKRDGVGGIHHLAYQVESVQAKMDEWKEKGYAEFSTQQPLTCPDLTQVFTKPSLLTGVIYEFIERGKHGFCKDNVRDLMISTDNFH
jgi:catechol 2,3-dioxygenase-like lactoylglutathione lyase family enzyme